MRFCGNSGHMQDSYGTPGTGYHPESDGGQAKYWSKAAGLRIDSDVLNIHNATKLCRKQGCGLSLQGQKCSELLGGIVQRSKTLVVMAWCAEVSRPGEEGHKGDLQPQASGDCGNSGSVPSTHPTNGSLPTKPTRFFP